jgi:hypothetical protein
LAKRWAVALALVALGAVGAGCGEEGVEEGATVSVYVSGPERGPEAAEGREQCGSARRALERAGGAAGEVRLRLVCLDASGEGGSWTLAQVGANARAATEDSTTVAYIGEPSRRARAQSGPIVEEADIAALGGLSGGEAMRQVLDAIEAGDSSSPREAVFEDPDVDHGS